MGADSSKNLSNYDMQIQDLKNDLQSLLFEAENLIKEQSPLASKFKDLRELISNDIKLIQNFLDSDLDLSLAAFCPNEKLQPIINTLFAERLNFNSKKYNVFKQHDKRLFQNYEKKLMDIIQAYSKDNSNLNYIFNHSIKNINRNKKIIFSNNLNDQNLLADELIVSIPPILSEDASKFGTLKSEIEKYSNTLTLQEKKFLNSEEIKQFLNNSYLQTKDNNFDTLMKFLFMLLNHDVMLYVFGDEYQREIDLFTTIINNNFLRSIIKHKKLLLIFPEKYNKNNLFKDSRQIELEKLLLEIEIQIFFVNFNDCYDDKLLFLGKLIIKRDPRSYFIPDNLKHQIEKLIYDDISESYERLKAEYEEMRKEQNAKKQVLVENIKTNPLLGGNESLTGKNDKKKGIFKKFLKHINQKLIDKVNEKYSEENNKLISKYEFEKIYIESLDTNFTTSSKIDKFEEKLYDVLKKELISKQNIIQSHLIFKCLLYKALINDEDFSKYNYIIEQREQIIDIIDNLNTVLDNTIQQFLKKYNSNIDEYLSTIELTENDFNHEDVSTMRTTFYDIFRNETFCPEYRQLNSLEEQFYEFEKSNIKEINFLSNYIQSHSAKSMEIIVNQYYALNKLFNSNFKDNKSRKLNISDYNSYRNEVENKSYHNGNAYFSTIKLENCRTSLDLVIWKKLQSFNLIHMILFNHYGFKNLNVKKPPVNYRIKFFSGLIFSVLFGYLTTRLKFKSIGQLVAGLISILSLGLGSYFANNSKNIFIIDSKKFLRINKFIISRYLRMKKLENADLSNTLMKFFKIISEESLGLMNSLAL